MILAVAEHGEAIRFRAELLFGMVKREVLGRYRGSMFGLVWSIVSPLLLLAVYTLAFHELFGARWPGAESRSGFATMAFVGLIVHGLLAETLMRAPDSISRQSNYVKKLVFPLTVLPLVPIGTALFHALLGLAVLIAFCLTIGPDIHWYALLAPLMLLPYMLGLCGVAWFMAALGVYVRDITQLSALLSTALMFISPIFYPASALPAKYGPLLALNPLTFVVESMRAMIFEGRLPDSAALASYAASSVVAAGLGLLVFRRLRPGFGDVL